MALFRVRDGFFSAQVSESSPSLKGEGWIRTRVPRKPISHEEQCHMHFFSKACNLKQLRKLTWVCTSVHRRQLLLVRGCPTWRRWKMCGFLRIITPRAHLHIRLPDLFSRPGDINVDYHNIGLTMLNVYMYESFISFIKEMIQFKHV